MNETLKFYFSFRSPYAWLAFNQISKIAGTLPVLIDLNPVLPPENFNDPGANPHKARYIKEDVQRFAGRYGLALDWPEAFDCDWFVPHAAFLAAQERGLGLAFGLAAFNARFSQGQDISQDAVLAQLATETGLAHEHLLQQAHDSNRHQQLHRAQRMAQRDGLFGVPFFVYQGRHYWGNDRLDWLLADIEETSKNNAGAKRDPWSRLEGK